MTTFFAFGLPGPTELWVILFIALLFFGTKIPAVMRSMGQGVSEFKKGLREESEDAPQDEPAAEIPSSSTPSSSTAGK
jgi:sec-independent protein translocase protein TatA